MPRIRRGGKRIRGANGGRTRKEDCCCEGVTLTCTEWNTEEVKSTIEWNVEVDGVTVGTNGCSNCASLSTPQILTWECHGSSFGGVYENTWCRTEVAGCIACGGFACRAIMRLTASCNTFTGIVSIELWYGLRAVDLGGADNWTIVYQGTAPVASLVAGEDAVLSYSSFSGSGSSCTPTGYTTSTAIVSFTI